MAGHSLVWHATPCGRPCRCATLLHSLKNAPQLWLHSSSLQPYLPQAGLVWHLGQTRSLPSGRADAERLGTKHQQLHSAHSAQLVTHTIGRILGREAVHQASCCYPQAGGRGALVLRCRACAAAGLPLRLVLLLTRLAQLPAANGTSPRAMVRRHAVLRAKLSNEYVPPYCRAAPVAMETGTGHVNGCLDVLQMQEAQFTVQPQGAGHSTPSPCMMVNKPLVCRETDRALAHGRHPRSRSQMP